MGDGLFVFSLDVREEMICVVQQLSIFRIKILPGIMCDFNYENKSRYGNSTHPDN
jgi:hypothetical protein